MATPIRNASLGVLTAFSAISALHGRELRFEDRVRAQEAIERVYHSHQIDTRAPFRDAVPRSVIEGKVQTYLRQSVALDEFWKTPVTGEMLEHELQRMIAGSRMPERLIELFAALGNDPYVIEECLARPALVDRLSRSFFASDERIHSEARGEAEALRAAVERGALNASASHARRSVVDLGEPAYGNATEPSRRFGFGRPRAPEVLARLHELSARWPNGIEPLIDGADSVGFRVKLGEGVDRSLRFAAYAVPKKSWEAWWNEVAPRLDPNRSPAVASGSKALSLVALWSRRSEEGFAISGTACSSNDTWDNRRFGEPSEARRNHTAVWTGSLMIVWGGEYESDFGEYSLGTGGRYDPATDTWTSTSTLNAPAPRTSHTAIWTGARMIVFGGLAISPMPNSPSADGAQYDPTSDTWQALSPANAPSPRYSHTAVWTGSRMVVWGGIGTSGESLGTGGVYDPAADTWTPTSVPAAPSARSYHSAVWTGSRMIVWGGNTADQTGGLYDPGSNTWSPTSLTGAPSARTAHTAVWTGSRMIVWGGSGGSGALSSGARYDPTTDSWLPTSVGVGSAAAHSAIWTGTHMIKWGGSFSSVGSRYDPQTDTWSSTTAVNAPAARAGHTAVWTGSRMIVWGGRRTLSPQTFESTGGRYDPTANAWTPTANSAAPAARLAPSAVWTGNLLIVWGGGVIVNFDQFAVLSFSTGGRYDPALDTWSPTSLGTGVPSGRYYHSAVWTGDRMVVWGGRESEASSPVQTGARYDPISDTWSPTSPANAPAARDSHTAVWTGSRMVIWGGDGASSGFLATGGRYDPVADSWVATSTSGAPQGRESHGAIWTGSRMIVWGGAASSGPLNTGGRYDPTTDAWQATSVLGAPSGQYQRAVWAGNRMIVWGPEAAGGRYDPVADAWVAISSSGAPTELRATAVSTGSRMIVWGGGVNSGAVYDTVTDSWTPTSLAGAPLERSFHAAVWTGRFMLVWGGGSAINAFPLNDGGRYVGVYPDDYDGDGQSGCDGDCDDTRADVYSGALELCDRLDNDCNGSIPANELDADLDGFTACEGDCNDANASIRPSAPEQCNGLDDNCDSIVPPGESDADGDGVRSCAGDCNDGAASVRPGAPQICDGLENNCSAPTWPAAPSNETDDDGDGYVECSPWTGPESPATVIAGGDCDDTYAPTHPGAPEVNDGRDNQCLGDAGYGAVDEISGVSGYHASSDETKFSWPAQLGATSYEVVRSPYPDFHAGCVNYTTSDTFWEDPFPPASGTLAYYLVRALTPFVGSWGLRSSGANRLVGSGCENTGDWCDDQSVCTSVDSCSGTICVGGAPLDCNDGNPCTSDSCDPVSGCVHANNTAPCSDGNACTLSDTCAGGTCVGGAPPTCDDLEECTDDTCDPATGCSFSNNANACDDGAACTTGDVCQNGVCSGTVPGSSARLVISQVQTAGSSADDEFIELYNPTPFAVTLSHSTLQYKSATGSTFVVASLGTGSVPAHGWYLIARSSYDGPVPADLVSNTIQLSGVAGHLFLVNNTLTLSGSCPGVSFSIIDKVGYGGSANCPEGSAAAAPSANNSIRRKPGGGCGNGTDTNSNTADFVTQSPSTPRNSASPPDF